MDDVARLLETLVAIPSVNPMGRSVSGAEYLESRLTDFLEGWLRGLGVRCQRQPVAPGRDNLLAWYEAPQPGRTILFDVHQDTVPADGMTVAPFAPVIVDDRMYGRGACDVKGSMAAMLAAFARLVRERPKASASLLLAFTVDEEFTHTGSSRLAEFEHGADVAIVAEPTKLNLVQSHKGALRWTIRTSGLACHSSTPEKGDNAIYKMGRVLGVLETFATTLARSTMDPVLGPPTLSIGRIEGGQSVNIVPDWCVVEVDRRLIPGEDAASSIKRVWDALESHGLDMSAITFGDPWVHMPPLPPRAGDWIGPLVHAVSRATGHAPAVIGVPFGTDAGPLSEKGTPCVVFGPGDIAQAHTKDEWVDLHEVRLAAEAYYQIAVELGQSGA